MSPRQKAFGYAVFLISLAAIAGMLVFVGGPVVSGLRKPVSISASVTKYYDPAHHVTCWVAMNGISCLRDKGE